MPTALREDQHELLSPDGALSFLFGTEDTRFVTLMPMSLSAIDGTLGDVERVREDGIALGEDYRGGKTATFEVGVLTDRAENPHRAGADALSQMESVWRDERLRNRSTQYAILRSKVAGRVTRAYGRPRRYEETAGRLTRRGYTPVVCDFLVPDGRWYADEAQAATCTLVHPPDGGLVAPLVSPLITTATGETGSSITIGGATDTWPVVTFHGPVTSPEADFGAFVVGLDATVPDGMSITVDPRPWVRQVSRSDGAGMGGTLTWETPPLRKCLLRPGDYEFIYRGTDATGTSWCQVEWRDAYPRP